MWLATKIVKMELYRQEVLQWKFSSPIHYLGAFAKVQNAIISFVVSVRPHVTTQLPLDGCS